MFKRGWTISLCLISTLTVTEVSLASAIGAPDSYWQIGAGISFSQVSVDEPKGGAEDKLAISPFNIAYKNRAFADYDYMVEGFFQELELDASTTDVGQDVERLGIRGSILKPVSLGSITGLWAGVGGHIARETYTGRHTVDRDGFLANSYDDRKETVLGVHAELLKNWNVKGRLDVAGRILYAQPIGDGAAEFVMSVYLFLPSRW